MALPREGHLVAVLRIFSYLKKHHNSRIAFDPTYPEIDQSQLPRKDWRRFYDNAEEPLPPNTLELLGKPITIRIYVDANHAGDQFSFIASLRGLNCQIGFWLKTEQEKQEIKLAHNYSPNPTFGHVSVIVGLNLGPEILSFLERFSPDVEIQRIFYRALSLQKGENLSTSQFLSLSLPLPSFSLTEVSCCLTPGQHLINSNPSCDIRTVRSMFDQCKNVKTLSGTPGLETRCKNTLTGLETQCKIIQLVVATK
jgi:hypothetical protein